MPATHAGVLEKILVQEGDVVQVGAPIAIINTNGEADAGDAGASAGQSTGITADKPVAAEEKTSSGPIPQPFLPNSFLNHARWPFLLSPGIEYCPRRRNFHAGTGIEYRVPEKTARNEKRHPGLYRKPKPATCCKASRQHHYRCTSGCATNCCSAGGRPTSFGIGKRQRRNH